MRLLNHPHSRLSGSRESTEKSKAEVEDILEKFAQKAGFTQAVVTCIPNPSDPKTAGVYNINPEFTSQEHVKAYKSQAVCHKTVNFVTTEASIKQLLTSIEMAEVAKKFDGLALVI